MKQLEFVNKVFEKVVRHELLVYDRPITAEDALLVSDLDCSDFIFDIEDCETFTDDYGNACYWDKGCKNDTSHECSDYTNLTECNAATDSNGNKCLWNISGVCEIEQNIKCSDYTNRSECNVSVDSDGNKCLWNVSSGCEIDDPNALG